MGDVAEGARAGERIRTEEVEYEADGRRMVGYLAVDDARSGPRPAVLVSHEGPGLDEHVKGRAERLAFEAEMRDTGVADWRLEVYGGVGHTFTNPAVDALGRPGMAFDAWADRRSWRSMLDLFAKTLGPV